MAAEVDKPLLETLHSGYIGQGAKVDEFERALAPYVGNSNVLTVNSGTSAIQLALRLSDVGSWDEVITTPMTCTATNMPILAAGAVPVWADIDPDTGNIDPAGVEKLITRSTKAILCVDWGGYPCDLNELMRIAQAYGLVLIEDAAHAFGAQYHAKPVGSQATFTCFSFQAIKTLTTGDGGALVCQWAEDHAHGKLLRWYGIDRDAPRQDLRCEADIAEWGYKFHMNDIAATIGLANLPSVSQALMASRVNALYYFEELAQVPGVKFLQRQHDRLSSYWLLTIRVKNKPDFIARMAERGVQCSSVHARNDKHTAFKDYRRDLPGVDEFDREQVSIPVGWWLTPEERAHVVASVRESVA